MGVSKSGERLLVYALGVVLIAILIISIFVVSDPTPFQYTILRILAALSCAGICAFLPGFVTVQIKKSIRAGGAIGVFCIVYFFAPAKLEPVYGLNKNPTTAAPEARPYEEVFGKKSEKNSFLIRDVRDTESNDLRQTFDIHTASPFDQYKDKITNISGSKIITGPGYKVLVPTSLGEKCPKTIFDRAIIAEAVSRYLTTGVKIILVNIVEDPKRVEVESFARQWGFGKEFYFLSGPPSARLSVLKKLRVYYSVDNYDPNNVIDHSTAAYIYGPNGKFMGIIPFHDGDINSSKSFTREILHAILETNPAYINRQMITLEPFQGAAWQLDTAYAASLTLTSDEAVDRAYEAREAKLRASNIELGCRDRRD